MKLSEKSFPTIKPKHIPILKLHYIYIMAVISPIVHCVVYQVFGLIEAAGIWWYADFRMKKVWNIIRDEIKSNQINKTHKNNLHIANIPIPELISEETVVLWDLTGKIINFIGEININFIKECVVNDAKCIKFNF